MPTLSLISPKINPPVLGPHFLTVSASRPYTKQCVHQITYTADLTEHSHVVQVAQLWQRNRASSINDFRWGGGQFD